MACIEFNSVFSAVFAGADINMECKIGDDIGLGLGSYTHQL